jgi:hypothetical protein
VTANFATVPEFGWAWSNEHIGSDPFHLDGFTPRARSPTCAAEDDGAGHALRFHCPPHKSALQRPEPVYRRDAQIACQSGSWIVGAE